MMRAYRFSLKVLAKEPETWLAYLYGQKLLEFPHLLQKKPRASGSILQCLVFFTHMARHFSLKDVRKRSKVDIMVFAGTDNQKNSLMPTIEALVGKGVLLDAIAPMELIRRSGTENIFRPLVFRPRDIVTAILLFLHRRVVLHRMVRAIHPYAASWHLSKFCLAYIYLCYFYGQLTVHAPKYILMSNDHNVSNRCLLAVAHELSIGTVYLQHASVSDKFPALRTTFAFLDGMHALDTYRQCERNGGARGSVSWTPKIYLTGQKKELSTRSSEVGARSVGVATNTLDTPGPIIELVQFLVANGTRVRFRWHPGQSQEDIAIYRMEFNGKPGVLLSDPRCESIADFLAKVGWLVSGNSSVHLEAALIGVHPIYYESTKSLMPDYYGYVKNGLARIAETVEDVVRIVDMNLELPPRAAVQYYSSTYGTVWQGREGELTAECLKAILSEQLPPISDVPLHRL